MISVLYVDDDRVLLDLGKLFLERTGDFQVELQDSAISALKILDSSQFDLILSDYEMPEMDGISFLKHVRERWNNIPFILFTGRGREEVVIEALNNGADFYLQKGGEPKAQFAELAHKIHQAVSKRRVEQAFAEQKSQLETLINAMPDIVCFKDAHGRWLKANTYDLELFQLTNVDYFGKTDCDLASFSPFYHDAFLTCESSDEIAWAKREISRNEEVIPRPDGSNKVFDIIKVPVFNPDGTRQGLVVVGRDITDRKRVEDALKESEKLYRSVIENIQDTYYRSDRAGNLIMASPSTMSLLGYDSVEEILGKPISDTFYYDPAERAFFIAELQKTGSVSNFDTRLKKRDGTMVYVSTSSHYYFDQSGAIAGVEGIIRDISEKKRAEDELRAAYEQIAASEEELKANLYDLTWQEQKIRENETHLRFKLGFYEKVGQSEKDILTYAIEGAGTITESPLAYLAFLNDDESELSMYAWSKNAMDECAIREKPIIYQVEKTGLWGEAVRQRQAVITNDYTAPNSKKKGYPKGHPHIIRHMNVPIFDGDHIVIVAGVANRSVNYSEYEVTQLTLLMQELWQVLKLRRAEKALAESEAKYRGLVESSQDAIFSVDRNGCYQFANITFASTLGHTPEYFYGKSFWDIYPKDLADMRYEGVLNVFETGEPNEVEVVVPLPDRRLYYLAKTNPIKDMQGNIVQVLVTATDITRRKEAENALRQSKDFTEQLIDTANAMVIGLDVYGNITLFNTVASDITGYTVAELGGRNWFEILVPKERYPYVWEEFNRLMEGGLPSKFENPILTKSGEERYIIWRNREIHDEKGGITGTLSFGIDITDRKLAEEALREANKKLNLLSSITRHDIMNKVSMQLGYLELVQEMVTDNPKIAAFIAKVEYAAQGIRDEIEFTRMYQDLGTDEPQWQDLHQSLMKTPFPKNIFISDSSAGTEILADVMLERVFANLIDNAIRHGGNVTTVSLTSDESEGTLVIRLEDNGIGIPSDEKERIFDRGYGKNTGLGLFLTREILAITGITINENGQPGTGARFEIRVPEGKWRRQK